MKIYYWSPFTSKVATIKAVINSAYGLKKLYNHETLSLNSLGEWDNYRKILTKYKINTIHNKFKLKKTNFNGFLRSRLAYIIIFLRSFFFLNKILKEKKPDYLIIHLITSLPIILFLIFNYKTKLVLRISGLPKMNFARKMLWKIAKKKNFFRHSSDKTHKKEFRGKKNFSK